jgi:hypothetical protein
MSFLGKLGAGIAKFGQLAQGALKPLGQIAKPAAGLVGAAATTFLPAPIAGTVSGIANKVADFVSSGRASDVVGKIANAAGALTGAVANPLPNS